MTVAYASAAEFETFSGQTAPADIDRQLVRASELVDAAVTSAFDVDTVTSLPTDATVAANLRDATCAVVEAWVEVGESNDVDGLAGTEVSVGQYSGLRAPTLPPRARRILHLGGLLRASTSVTPSSEFFATTT